MFKNLLEKLKLNGRTKNKSVIAGELQSILNAGEEDGLIDEQSGEMIKGILGFRDTVAREVMVPRTEIIAVSIGADVEEIIETTLKHGHTRLPVYETTIDNIVGILNVKDLLQFWFKKVSERDVRSILRKAYFIPEAKNILHLLHELREKKSHLAIVIDEYGGTAGLVTMEDLIEEIVGEINDEHDQEEEDFHKLPGGEVIVDARTEVEEFEEYFGVSVPEGKFETVGGLIFHLIKRIPVAGEIIGFKNLELVIEEADPKTIKKVLVRLPGGGSDTPNQADSEGKEP
ncbi:MAG: HlyC/CorC family transporter [Deltaproteobacteria bacterium]|nr:HlyC/CorC family transporter [Deltaproteobacteria bacterium]